MPLVDGNPLAFAIFLFTILLLQQNMMDLVQGLNAHIGDTPDVYIPDVFNVHMVLMDMTTILNIILHDYQFS